MISSPGKAWASETASANANSVMVGGAAGNGGQAYAEPGVYTMTVQYVLLEDQ